MIDKELLYKDGLCRLCELPREDYHAEGCPGPVIDGLQFTITYAADRCSRGCCGSFRGSVDGETEESVLDQAQLALDDGVYMSADLSFTSTYETRSVVDEIKDLRGKRWAKEKAAREAIDRADKAREIEAQRQRSLQALELERPDLTPEAYERRRAVLSG